MTCTIVAKSGFNATSLRLTLDMFGKFPGVEVRKSLYELVDLFGDDKDGSVVTCLETVCGRETGDGVDLCARVYCNVLKNGMSGISGKGIKFLTACLASPKTSLRRAFLAGFVHTSLPVSEKDKVGVVSILKSRLDDLGKGEGVYSEMILIKTALSRLDASTSIVEIFIERQYSKLDDSTLGLFLDILLTTAKDMETGEVQEGVAEAIGWVLMNASYQKVQLLLKGLENISHKLRTSLILKGLHTHLPQPVATIWTETPAICSSSLAARAVEALMVAISGTNAEKEEALVECFLICGHPLIVQTFGSDLWISLCFRVSIAPTFLRSVSIDVVERWMDGIFERRVETLGALRLATQISPQIVPYLLKWTYHALSPSNLTLTDISIYESPVGVIWHPKENVEVNKKLSEEEVWELEIRKKADARKGRSKEEEHGDRVLIAHQDTIRQRVSQAKQQAAVALDVIAVIVAGEGRGWMNGCWGLVEKLVEVLKREFGGKGGEGVVAGVRTVEVLGCVVGTCLGKDGEAIVAGMILAVGVSNAVVREKFRGSFENLIGKTFESILEWCEDGPLSAPAFVVLFPLIRAVIFKQGRLSKMSEHTYVELVLKCADFLLLHTGLDGENSIDVPRGGMVSCLLEILEVYPRLRVSAKGGLLALVVSASHLEEEDKGINEDIVVSLLAGLKNGEDRVRECCLAALIHLSIPDRLSAEHQIAIWICKCDHDEDVAQEASVLWEDVYGDKSLDVELLKPLTDFVWHSEETVGGAAGRALCECLKDTNEVPFVVGVLYAKYSDMAADPIPIIDAYGMVDIESLNRPDQWMGRRGIALALTACVEVMVGKDVVLGFFDFLIKSGLGDKDERVRRAMLDSGLAMLEKQARPFIVELLDLFDAGLKSECGSSTEDGIREAIVILMGTLAHHLASDDPRIGETVAKLIETLKTPSEAVQIAVSECLPALIKVNKTQVAKLVKSLLDMLFTSEKYGHRRGAAYGLAGIVNGAGLAALKDYSIMAHLKDAVEDKRNVTRRQGALFAFETLSYILGRRFEPYVIQLLPYLLNCYGDVNKQIRDATEDTCRVIMSRLSAHCVKLVMPSLLDGLQERAFRTKIGAIEVMASMSSLAPKQLGQSLPTIVPKICEALGDSHQKVQDAAKEALGQFGRVIKNPEIQELVPVLITALVNPNNKTQAALSALLDTTFVHYIDAPSLALLVPIIERGMKERSAETKKKASQIMGNMSSLTDPRDLIPYLDTLLPPLKEVLVDPVPEARATAARAFGSMVEKLGEERFPGLVSELLDTLQTGDSGVDLSGAAQGLSCVLAGIGIERLDGLMPLILSSANSLKASAREGFTTLLVFLPATFGDKFTPYISQIVPTILEGLADESDSVREAALSVGKVIVKNYSKSAVSLLLPELEQGLFNEK